jgi:hypothetical protein
MISVELLLDKDSDSISMIPNTWERNTYIPTERFSSTGYASSAPNSIPKDNIPPYMKLRRPDTISINNQVLLVDVIVTQNPTDDPADKKLNMMFTAWKCPE